MTAEKHKWEFRPRFRRDAFGWQSAPAAKRIKEAVKEIKTVAKSDPILAAEGAVIFLEKLAPALTHVDDSSGSLGRHIAKAMDDLVPIIANAQASEQLRDKWLERLWKAHAEDSKPSIEPLADHWGQLCASPSKASEWVDKTIEEVRAFREPGGEFFRGTCACLSALIKAERYSELFQLLDHKRMQLHSYQIYGEKANLARELGIGAIEVSGKRAPRSKQDAAPPATEADYQKFLSTCEISGSYLNFHRSAVKTFSFISPEKILQDLIARTPGAEGKWFAAAKELKEYELATRLAASNPCDPRTLSRAARDFRESQPEFAADCGLLSLHWLIQGYGMEIDASDIREAFHNAIKAAKVAGKKEQALRILAAAVTTKNKNSTIYKVLAPLVGVGKT